MAKEVIFKLNIDGGNSVSIIKQIQTELGKLNNEFSKTNTGAQLDTRIQALSKSLTELKSKGGGESLTAIRQEVKLLDLQLGQLTEGTQEYNSKLKELSSRRADLNDLRNSINALDPEKKFQALAKVGTAVVGGYTAMIGATNLFGKSNETLEKSLVKVQSALGLLNGLQAIVDSKDDIKILGKALGFDKLASAIRGTGVATTGADKSAKIFRTTLISLGIGAVVVGLGLLIANFDKLKNIFSSVSASQTKLNSTRDESIKSIAQEKESIGQLVTEYQKADTSDQRRKQIKEELIKTSPNYFGILDKEKVTVEQLTTAYNNWSTALLLKAENDELIKKISEQKVKILETENTSVKDNVDLLETSINFLTSFGNIVIFNSKQIQTGVENQKKSIKEATDDITLYQKRLEDNQKKISNAGGDVKDDPNKRLEDEIKKAKELREKQFEEEIKQIKQQELIRKTELLKSGESPEQIQTGNDQIIVDTLNKELLVYKKYGKDVNQIVFDIAQKEYDIVKSSAETRLKLIEDAKKREEDAVSKFKSNTDREYQDDLNNLQDYLSQKESDIINSNKSESEKEKELTAIKKLELQEKKKIQLDYGKDVRDINKQIYDTEKDESKKSLQEFKDNQLAIIESITSTINAVVDIVANASNSRLDELRNQLDEYTNEQQQKIDAQTEQENLKLEIQKAQGLFSDTEFAKKKLEIAKKSEAEKKKLDEETNKRKRKFDYDQAVQERKLAISSIAINIAQAIAKELATKGTLGFAFLAPLITAGVTSTAIVLSQPLPALAKGGVVNKYGKVNNYNSNSTSSSNRNLFNTSNSSINNNSSSSTSSLLNSNTLLNTNNTLNSNSSALSSLVNNSNSNSFDELVNNFYTNSSNSNLIDGGNTNKYYTSNYNGGGTVVNEGTSGKADDVLIRISKGESVINSASTKKHFKLLSMINQDGNNGRAFASGGIPLPGSNPVQNILQSNLESKEQIELLQQVRDLLTVPNRSYVLETDITNSQNSIKKIEKRAEF